MQLRTAYAKILCHRWKTLYCQTITTHFKINVACMRRTYGVCAAYVRRTRRMRGLRRLSRDYRGLTFDYAHETQTFYYAHLTIADWHWCFIVLVSVASIMQQSTAYALRARRVCLSLQWFETCKIAKKHNIQKANALVYVCWLCMLLIPSCEKYSVRSAYVTNMSFSSMLWQVQF